MMRRIALACLSSILIVAAAAAQDREPGQGLDARAANLSPVEVQRLFDAYAVVQAQEMLKLSDAQYAQFVAKLKTLQEARRRNQQARNQILQDLRRLSMSSDGDNDGMIKERLRALHEHDARAAAELQKAYDGVDQVLDIRQQARFRIFEEQMERRKFELLMRARQATRPNMRRNF